MLASIYLHQHARDKNASYFAIRGIVETVFVDLCVGSESW